MSQKIKLIKNKYCKISLTDKVNAEYCYRQIPHSVKKYKSASITVEAALAFPVFFFACMAFCYLFIFLQTEYKVQRSLYYTARSVSSYGDIVEPLAEAKKNYLGDIEEEMFSGMGKAVGSLLENLAEKLTGADDISLDTLVTNAADNIIVGSLVKTQLPNDVYRCIAGGSAGMDFRGSVLFDKDKCIQIVCNYRLELPGGIFKGIGIPVSHFLKYRYFCGNEVKSLLQEVESESPETEEESDDEEIVLITDTGYCYHFSYSCPSLNIKPKDAKTADVGELRNNGGAKYYPCEYCVKRKTTRFDCYITPDGDRYHYDKKCQGLKRTIYEVKISEVGKKRPCKRCSKK